MPMTQPGRVQSTKESQEIMSAKTNLKQVAFVTGTSSGIRLGITQTSPATGLFNARTDNLSCTYAD